jgi:Plasma-membrane choline transporter
MNNQYQYSYNTTHMSPNPVEGYPVEGYPVDNNQTQNNQTVEGVPLKQPIYEENANQNSKWNDLFFLFLFIAQLISVFTYGGINMQSYSITLTNSTSTNPHFGSYMTISLLVSLVFSYIILGIMKAFPEGFIRGANIALITFNVIAMFLAFAHSLVGLGIIFMLQVIIIGLWYYFAQAYIPFSKMLLKTSTTILGNNATVYAIPFIGLIFASVYSVFLLYAITPSVEKLNNGEGGGYLVLLFIFLFFWTQQVTANVVHVTVAGVVGKWYYKNNDTTSIVWSAFKRATTKSLGSVCFGSLIVAVIKTIQFIIRAASKNTDNPCLMCCLQCVIGCLEQLVEYFNEYAFAYVGIYGLSYIESAKKTWEMAKDHFITVLFNDNLIYPVLLFSNIFVGLFTGLVCWLLLNNLHTALACGILGYAIASVVTTVVHSAIVALFVCCIESYETLNTLATELYNEINIREIEIRQQQEAAQNNNRFSEV